MATIPSINHLAKDVVGAAIELVGSDEARELIKSLRVEYYNLALSEIFRIISLTEQQSLVATANISPTGVEATAKYFELSIANLSVDHILYLIVKDATPNFYESERISYRDFMTHRMNKKAQHPYDSMFVYTEALGKILVLEGGSLATTLASLTPVLHYVVAPTVLTRASFDTAYMGCPDRYYYAMVTRVASFAEMRRGITDKTVFLAKNAYENLMSGIQIDSARNFVNSIFGIQNDVSSNNR